MSECVVRMEMPRNCHECPVSYQSYGDTPCWCKLAFEKNEAVSDGLMWREVDPQTRPDWCPIICQLPEGHGRLVDADEIMQDIDEDIELDSRGLDDMYITGRVRERLRMDRGYKKRFKEYMRKRPTIVPAERSET